MFTLYRIALAPARKPYQIGLLFTHKNDNDNDNDNDNAAMLRHGFPKVKSHIGQVFTLYRIAFAPARKPYRIGLLFTHKNDNDNDNAAMLRRAFPKVKSHIGQVFTLYRIAFCVCTCSYPVKSEHSISLCIISIIFHLKKMELRDVCCALKTCK